MHRIPFFAVLAVLVTPMSAAAATVYTPVNLSSQANFTWLAPQRDPIGLTGTYFPGGPSGSVSLAGIPFNILSNAAGFQAWNGYVASGGGNGTVSITMQVGVYGVTDVYTLINTYWGAPGVSYTALVFTGSAGANYRVNLIGSSDIRGWCCVGTINGTSTINVYSVASSPLNGAAGYLDMQHIVLPTAFATQALASIQLIDSGATGVQRTILDGVTVASTSGPLTPIVLPQLAFGGGWYTALYFTNTSTIPASFTVSFIGNDGNSLTIPALGGSSVTVNLAARGTALIEAPNVGSLAQGYVSAVLPPGVTGYGVFRASNPGVNDQEAVVPLSGATATVSTLLFDDTNYVTGVAIVNLASVSTTISVFARDAQGNTIGTSNIPLAPRAKTAMVLKDLPGLSRVSGSRGSVDFTANIGTLAVLGLRFNGLAFTSIPTSDK